MMQSTSRRTLLRGGHVVTLDPHIGDLPEGDVLIEGNEIADIGPSLDVADAEVIDASSMLVMPGLVDTHRHTWQTALRASVDATSYFSTVLVKLGPLFRPEDVYIGNLLGAVGALDSGITTMLDWSHIMNSPLHADAAVEGLRDAGIRAVFAHGVGQNGLSAGVSGSNAQQHPEDIHRVQNQYFSSDDQLLTLALAYGGPEFSSIEGTIADVTLARDMGIRLTTHVGVLPGKNAITKMHEAGLLGPDMTFIHAGLCSEDEIKMIAASGGSLSSSPLTEDLPGLSMWLRNGLRPSLSLDSEVLSPTDLFTQMRAMLSHSWIAERAVPDRVAVSTRDMLEFATIEGARAAGLDHKIGTLAPGKRADLLMIDLDDVALIPRTHDPVSTAVLMANPRHVKWVLVDGEVRKRDGNLVGVDVNRMAELARASRSHLANAAGLRI